MKLRERAGAKHVAAFDREVILCVVANSCRGCAVLRMVRPSPNQSASEVRKA